MKCALPILMLVLMALISSDGKANGESQRTPAFEDRKSLAQEPLVEEDRASRKLFRNIKKFRSCVEHYARDWGAFWSDCIRKSFTKIPISKDEFFKFQWCSCEYFGARRPMRNLLIFVTCVDGLDPRFRATGYEKCGYPGYPGHKWGWE